MSQEPACTNSRCGCAGGNRRQFLQRLSATAVAAAVDWPAMAGPFAPGDFTGLVPTDKKLSPDWVRSLFARGEPTVYRGSELDKIGMPIGGLCAGQVYLGGDGRLWHWDIFNQHVATGAEHYAQPMAPGSPLEQGFAVQILDEGKSQIRPLDRRGWSDVAFRGEYPLARVEYRDPDSPLAVTLEAYSPFVPLATDDSSLPATVLSFTLENRSPRRVDVELAGWLANAVCLHSAKSGDGLLHSAVVRTDKLLAIEHTASPARPPQPAARRPDVVLEDFEKPTYEGWTATGTAFAAGPIEKARLPAYQGDVGAVGERLVNTHNARQGEDVAHGDQHVGTLTSRPFQIERQYLNFLIGGGSHPGRTCLNLLVDGRQVATATGKNDNRMRPAHFDLRRHQGRTAQLQIVDSEPGAWGNIGLDQIVLSDTPAVAAGPLESQPDFGSLTLALLDPRADDRAVTALGESGIPQGVFRAAAVADGPATRPFGHSLVASLARRTTLAAGQRATVTFAVTWHFPNLRIQAGPKLVGRRYAVRFPSARAVAEHLAENFARLDQQTRLWHATWYDATLPYWFLDRTFANTSILATSTCHWLANGRFYGWEGVGCCEGTCTHVWHYAQAVARLFPELERSAREMVDFGLAQKPDGLIPVRGEVQEVFAADGHGGTILRAYREHQMSADGAFLRRIWPGVKRAIEYLVRQDADADGLLEGRQHNTLDADWFGPVAWLSSIYLAALRAGEEMANELGDAALAARLRTIYRSGRQRIVAELFNGEYFIHKPDPKYPEALRSGEGCQIDQVFGQHWAWQVGLGRIMAAEPVGKALRALWKYNFTPDVGPYRAVHKAGRWYAMPGEAGLLMCTFPRGPDPVLHAGKYNRQLDFAAGYFNECMNGFEYQVAGHMLWEGLVQEGLAITRAVHDRYHAARRNPWNEVECGDHYARSMASYGVYLAACGYEHHGPRGHLGFAPRLSPERFRAAFTAAEGWGTFEQRRSAARQQASLAVKWGRLRLRTLALDVPAEIDAARLAVTVAGKPVPAAARREGTRVLLTLAAETTLNAGERIEVVLGG